MSAFGTDRVSGGAHQSGGANHWPSRIAFWGIQLAAVIPILWLIYNQRVMWLMPSEELAANAWIFLPFAMALGALPVYANLEGFRAYFSVMKFTVGPRYGVLGNLIVTWATASFVALSFVYIAAPLASTYIGGETVSRTFEVKRVKRGFRSCAGYVLLNRSLLATNRICSVPTDVIRGIGARGQITLKGVQSAIAFRPTGIESFKAN